MLNKKKIIEIVGIYIGIPLLFYIIFSAIGLLVDKQFLSGYNLTIFVKNFVYTGLIGVALSFHVLSGRFDFSLGSTMILSSIIGGNIAIRLGLNSFGMVILFGIVGGLLGMLAGSLYIVLRLPAMVTSLGVVLIFEALTAILFNGEGVILTGLNYHLMSMANVSNVIIMAMVIALFVFILYNYSKFGYNKRSLASGQEVAVNIGINEKRNVLICYIIAGIIMGVVGIIPLSYSQSIYPRTDMSSITIMFEGFLALFIGEAIARKGELISGILVGALISSLIGSFLAMIGLDVYIQGLVNALILLGFLVMNKRIGNNEQIKLLVLRKKAILEMEKNKM